MLEHQLRRLPGELPATPAPLELILHAGDGSSPLAAEFERLAKDVCAHSRHAITVRAGDGRGPVATPALTLAQGDRRSIHYLAPPVGLEAEPFVDLLIEMTQANGGPEPTGAVRLAKPVEILVFVATACPHCAQAVRTAHALALASPQVTVHIVDAQHFAELAEQHGVRSVPVTLIDGGLGLVGATTPHELAERISARGTPVYETELLRSLVETGRFPKLVERVCGSEGATAFAAAWRDSSLSLRMGLMVTAEKVLDVDEHALDPIVADLVLALDASEPGLRGDTADLLGQIGHAAALPALEAHAQDPDPDVAEAIADAIEQITERGTG